jgi:hypothetical protein
METPSQSGIFGNLLTTAERLKSATSITTTGAVIGALLASVASFTFRHEFPSYALATASALLAALGYGAVYQKARKVELTIGDYLLKGLSLAFRNLPPPRRKAALELLFTLAEASKQTKARRVLDLLDLPSLASTEGFSLDEAREILDLLQEVGIVVVQKHGNEEWVSLSHDLLATFFLESRQKIILDLLFKEE